MGQGSIPQRAHTGFEDASTEDLYEVVGHQVFAGVTGGSWDVAIINFGTWQGGAQVQYRVISEGNAAKLKVKSSLVGDALGELCYRMAEAGHGWNVATYRLTSEGQMNIKFGLREEPWELDFSEDYVA